VHRFCRVSCPPPRLTLIIAGEGKTDAYFAAKMDAVKHPCLHIKAALPGDLSPYDSIVLDSVTRLNLMPEDFGMLKARYPCKSLSMCTR